MKQPSEHLLARFGVYRIATPSPFTSIATNCYLIDGDSPTLIDTGLATEDAYDALRAGLAQAGRSIERVERIVLTHGHADHRALAARIREETGARVFCHPLETDKVARVSPSQLSSRREKEFAFFRSMGVAEELLETLVDGPQKPSLKPRVDAVTHLHDGDEILIGKRRLRVLHTPGHSSGSICLYDEANRLLLTGDTLLPTSHITALIDVAMLDGDPDYNPLRLHCESLQRLRELGPVSALPGHGDVFAEREAVITTLFERHAKRRRHILRSLRGGPRTPFQICRSVFPFTPPDDLYLALSELLGNLGILVTETKVTSYRRRGLVYFEKR